MSAFLPSDARSTTLARGGRWHGRYGTISCPVCQPEGRSDQDALTISDGAKGLLLHCKKFGCNFRDILVGLGIHYGPLTTPDPAIIARRAADQRAEAQNRARLARMLWDEAEPIQDTIAEAYLHGRGITCALPETLRYHPKCWHRSGRCFPAMVACVDGVERFAVHRTYLRPDGSGKAEVERAKAMLGSVQGGAVWLARGDGPLVVAEGIETALSLASGLLRAPAIVWAALSTAGLRGLRLPDGLGRLIIAADGDGAGIEAAHSLAARAYGSGWEVSFLTAPEDCDWNDVLQGKVPSS